MTPNFAYLTVCIFQFFQILLNLDKVTKEPIKEPARLERMGWPAKLEAATAKMGARFIDYELNTGTWSFRVAHFSKYGLDDSDDEVEEEVEKAPPVSALPVPANILPQAPPKGLGGGGANTTAASGLGGGGLGGCGEGESITAPREAVSFLPTADSLAGCQKIQVFLFEFYPFSNEVSEHEILALWRCRC